MTPGAGRAAREPGALRLLPLLLVAVALLPNLAAALPFASYYFRDLSARFLPLRLFQARELAAGRLALWNPYSFEGSFQLPALYPPDLLHALWPSPVFVSWLLTLHLPLAALGAYWLARELGASRPGAFVAGASFALSGFTLSCLSLYTGLQALALCPFVAGLLRRAARDGGRTLPLAASVLAIAISTLSLELVLQAILLGAALGLAQAPSRAALARVAAALALGAGLAALPLALVASLLPETGLAGTAVPGSAIHPAALGQLLLPHLFGFPQSPAEAFWGGRFFSGGLPHLLSLYVGPLTLGFASVGLPRLPRAARGVLLLLAGLGLWYALGEHGGLAPLLARLPLAAALGHPSHALLLPQLALSLCAAFAAESLLAGRGFARLAAAAAVAALSALALALALTAAPAGLVAWSAVEPSAWPRLLEVVRRETGVLVLLALAAAGAALAVGRGMLRPGRAVTLLVALGVADLARAGVGINRQVDASFFDPLPELAGLQLDRLDGARVFSYGQPHSPAFRAFLERGGPPLTLAHFFLHRQLLGPDANLLDQVEVTEAPGARALLPRARELEAPLYEPERIAELLPWLRNAGVARVLSLDPLTHTALVPLATLPAGPAGLSIHAYGFDPWPRASLACRATPVATQLQALQAPYRPGFDPWRELALERVGGEGPDDALAATCTKGRARRTAATPGEEHYEVESNASAYLVVRASHARGWRAHVDGVPTPVVRANGKHRAVAVSAGRHEVVLRYHAPGLVPGLALSLLALLVAGVLFVAGAPRGRR